MAAAVTSCLNSVFACFESAFSCWDSQKRARQGLYEPLLAENEREAVADLLHYLESQPAGPSFFQGDQLRAVSTLAYSDNVDLKRSAALAFAEVTEKDVPLLTRTALEPLLYLLQSNDSEVQRASAAALGNLAVEPHNKLLIVEVGALDPLVRLMQSSNVEVQCNAVGCITNLATHESTRHLISHSAALAPLVRLARSRDLRVSRNAAGALLNMTHSESHRAELVRAGAVPVMVALLGSSDSEVVYYVVTGLSNLAVDAANRPRLAAEPRLVPHLVTLLSSPSPKLSVQSTLALRNLASDPSFQPLIVSRGALSPLLKQLRGAVTRGDAAAVSAGVALVRNLSIHADNEGEIVSGGFLPVLVELVGWGLPPQEPGAPGGGAGAAATALQEEIACHALSTLRNLAGSHAEEISKAGAVDKIAQVVAGVGGRAAGVSVVAEGAACVAVIGLNETTKSLIFSTPLPLTLLALTSPMFPPQLQLNAASALGNLASGTGSATAGHALWFARNWDGVREYLARFVEGDDAVGWHVAGWTVGQLLVGGDPDVAKLVGVSELPEMFATLVERVEEAVRAVKEERARNGGEGDDQVDLEEVEEIGELARGVVERVKAWRDAAGSTATATGSSNGQSQQGSSAR
ncbi:ARM repeat-containing protein [Gonapodya prolifera JEL478]|uniref:Vacuolar protein 8 n=1 Tax=Gonapodya prolifera (strain JEL478) TaxID=1344416 RepID=A0A139A5K2_GONPJ|nr:ARM repeat-containing protein [Gonapodya prolifera JEL478]|eukprot:KXS12102.1 ARM repeat-containing protein [Gonapodya prolifera JEL478]